MWFIIFLLILIIVLSIGKSGTAEKPEYLKVQYPFYVIHRIEKCPEFIIPEYCHPVPDIIENQVPDFSPRIKQLYTSSNFDIFYYNANYRHFIDNMEYLIFYSCAEFLLREYKKIGPIDIILLEPRFGIVANLLAEIFKVRVHFFTLKNKTVKPHKKVTVYNRIPNVGDFQRLRYKILLNYSIWTGKNTSSVEMFNAGRFQIYFASYLIDGFFPICSSSLLYSNRGEFSIPLHKGKIKLAPFSHNCAHPFFILEKEYKQHQEIHKSVINLEDLAIRLYIFNICMRNNRINFDVDFAENVLVQTNCKLITETLGPVPKFKDMAREIACTQIIPDIKNAEYFTIRTDNFDYSVFTGNFWNYAKLLPFEKMDITNPPLQIKRGFINMINEGNCLTIVRGLFELNKTQKFGFFDAMEYFSAIKGYGKYFFTIIPQKIIKMIKDLNFKNYQIASEREAHEICKTEGRLLLPEDLDHPLLVKEIAVKLKKLKYPSGFHEAKYIWCDGCEPFISAFHSAFPKKKLRVIGRARSRSFVKFYSETAMNDEGREGDYYWNIF